VLGSGAVGERLWKKKEVRLVVGNV
jgi:hypothetical protein